MKNLAAKIEALLFVSGEPVALKKLCSALNAKPEEVQSALLQLKGQLEGRGVALAEKDGAYSLVTAPEAADAVEAFTKEELGEDLSRAALETLTIVAYRGPVSRAEIDYIRGVNSSFTLRNLLIRGLIERVTNPNDSRVLLYYPSFDFLKFTGITRIENLPQYEEFRREIAGLHDAKKEGAEEQTTEQ